MKKVLIAGLSILSLASQADYLSTKITGKKAQALYEALKKVTHSKKSKIDFIELSCSYQGPGTGNECHDCNKGKDEKGNPCKTCSELSPKYPNHCDMNGEELEGSKKSMAPLGKALGDIKTSDPDGGMGGWTEEKIESGSCKKVGQKYECEYSYTTMD